MATAFCFASRVVAFSRPTFVQALTLPTLRIQSLGSVVVSIRSGEHEWSPAMPAQAAKSMQTGAVRPSPSTRVAQ